MGDTFYLKSGDTAPRLAATLTDASGNPIDLTGAHVALQLTEPRGSATVLDQTMDTPSPEQGDVEYDWTDGDADDAGRYRVEFVVTYPDNSVETFPNAGYHTLFISE